VTFNLKSPDGSWVGSYEVEKLASTRGIQLRTGCFCNPGACSKYLELTHTELYSNFQSGHVCWDDNDIISGRPTGAVRVSFGYMSTFEDARAFVSFIDEFFVSRISSFRDGKMPKDRRESDLGIGSLMTTSTERKHYLESITVYPIKSCAGFSVQCWPLSDTGKEDIAQKEIQPQHISQLSQNKSASKGCATQGEVFNGKHNHKLQTMKKPPKDAQLQGRRPIT